MIDQNDASQFQKMYRDKLPTKLFHLHLISDDLLWLQRWMTSVKIKPSLSGVVRGALYFMRKLGESKTYKLIHWPSVGKGAGRRLPGEGGKGGPRIA